MDNLPMPAPGLLDAWCASGWNPHETVNQSIVVVAASWSDASLHEALQEMERLAPHGNFKVGPLSPTTMPQQLQQPHSPVSPSTPAQPEQPASAGTDASGRTQWPLHFEHVADLEPGVLQIEASHSDWRAAGFELRVRYNRKVDAFRGAGHVLAGLVGLTGADAEAEVRERFTIEERAYFKRHGLMLDCSRGGVPNLTTVKLFLARMGMLGVNTLMLYTEDTFEVPGEPFFGYLRGRLSQAELKEIDDYAFSFGIEVIPCIQTLGHLGQMLQWPRYHHLRDTHEILLAHSKDTYDFLERMMHAACSPFRSKKVHIGMDECFGLGEGRHRSFFPGSNRTQVFLDHLDAVTRICQSYGLEPLIWSDMLFCLANQNISLQGYYDTSGVTSVSNGATCAPGGSALPQIELVYWDYYHTAEQSYQERIQAHRQLGCGDPWVAGGIWTWNRLWTATPFTLQATRACLNACKGKPLGEGAPGRAGGVRNVITTVWGDDGNECDWFSAFPGLVYYAHLGFTDSDEVSPAMQSRWFAGVFGGKLFDWIQACRVDHLTLEPAPVNAHTQFPPNMGKWLLWEDPIHGHLSPQAPPTAATEYAALHAQLVRATGPSAMQAFPLNSHLAIAREHARVLALKAGLRAQLRAAYAAGSLHELARLAESRVSLLPRAVRAMWAVHRANWMRRFKPHGWEIVEMRYGALAARADTLNDRLTAYLRTQGHMQLPAQVSEGKGAATGGMAASQQANGDDEGANGMIEDSSDATAKGVGNLTLTPHDLSEGLENVGKDGAAFGSDDPVQFLEELSEDTLPVWEGLGDRVVIDYARACTPMRGMGTG